MAHFEGGTLGIKFKGSVGKKCSSKAFHRRFCAVVIYYRIVPVVEKAKQLGKAFEGVCCLAFFVVRGKALLQLSPMFCESTKSRRATPLPFFLCTTRGLLKMIIEDDLGGDVV